MSYTDLMSTMRSTGIGLAGVDGAWWLPATAPFIMGEYEYNQLSDIGNALFELTDAIAAELREYPDGDFAQLLSYKVPPAIAAHLDLAPVLSFRPDFQLVPTSDGMQFVLTEIEIAPSSEGFVHAMQLAYGVPTDIVPAFARFLAGRELLFAGTHEWSIYQYDQLAFCNALAKYDANAYALYDRTIAQMEEEIQRGVRWQLPVIGINGTPEQWEPSMTAHIARHGLAPFVRDEWAEDVGDTVVFRFGYVGNFDRTHRAYFQQWQQRAATFLNPFSFHLDNKVMLMGIRTASIRNRLDAGTIAVLERCIPETTLLTTANISRLVAEKESWMIKFAGFDEGNEAWGGRSVRFGVSFSHDAWRELLHEAAQLAWPVVAQRLTVSQQLTIDYYRPDGSIGTLYDGFTRLRTFFLRHRKGEESTHCGSHLTVTSGTMQVSEASDAVQTPVLFH